MIRLSKEVYQLIREHGRKEYPYECVGFIYGRTTETGKEITSAVAVDNAVVENKRRRFSVEPLEYMKAENYALENKLELLGVYHSHPDHPAIPSEHDLRQAMPLFSYFIISIREGEAEELRSWTLDDNSQFIEEELEQEIIITENSK